MPVNPKRGDVKLGAGSVPQNKPSPARVEGSDSAGDATSEDPPPAGKAEIEGPFASKKTLTNGIVPAKLPVQKKDGVPANTRKAKPKARRRSIFSQYMKEEDTQSNGDDSSACERHSENILEFSPPADHRADLERRFKLLDQFPLERTQDLPPLPTPLLRYTSEGSATNGGVYPMVEPVSILRKGKYSSIQEGSSSPSNKGQDTHTIRESASNDIFWPNTSDSSSINGHHGRLSDFEHIARNLNLEDTKRFFRESGYDASFREHVVKFDPRIVITEFPDDERDWFTDDELNRFKHETLMLAKHYMMLHPECAEEFNSPKIDPITGKVRRKALYALPGLCSADGLDSFGSSVEIERLLKNAVRKILIVDPNKSILHLFQKSIQQMFPTAKFTLVQSGDEALRLYTTELERQKNRWDGHNRGFDIVVVEEQLSQRRVKRGGKESIHHSARMIRTSSDSSAYSKSATGLRNLPIEDKGMPKQDSLFNLRSLHSSAHGIERNFIISGSQLIQRICQLENEFYGQSESSESPRESEALMSDESSIFSPPQRWSLVIGVSVNVERDSRKLKNSGADLVWGKPPPTMGNSLRNKLISALIAKRQKASFCILPTDNKDAPLNGS